MTSAQQRTGKPRSACYLSVMCNLYRMTKGVTEVAQMFDARPADGANFAEEVYPGYAGLVIAEGLVRPMTWGFPRAMTGKQGQALKPKPVNNAREDRLGTAFWRDSFIHRRCLIPVTAWAEAEGERGRMTRTWHWLPGHAAFALAGIWRSTAEWGDAYSMVMVDGCAQMAQANDRMPVILEQADWARWQTGSPGEAFNLCRTWEDELGIERTIEPWAQRATPTVTAMPSLFG